MEEARLHRTPFWAICIKLGSRKWTAGWSPGRSDGRPSGRIVGVDGSRCAQSSEGLQGIPTISAPALLPLLRAPDLLLTRRFTDRTVLADERCLGNVVDPLVE
jgi:hypothetical protein